MPRNKNGIHNGMAQDLIPLFKKSLLVMCKPL